MFPFFRLEISDSFRIVTRCYYYLSLLCPKSFRPEIRVHWDPFSIWETLGLKKVSIDSLNIWSTEVPSEIWVSKTLEVKGRGRVVIPRLLYEENV